MSAEVAPSNRPRESDLESEAEPSISVSAEAGPSTSHPKPKRKKSEKKSSQSPGIVYISRLPPGMTPQKVKHLMERWGEVGKIYAQKKDRESTIVTNIWRGRHLKPDCVTPTFQLL